MCVSFAMCERFWMFVSFSMVSDVSCGQVFGCVLDFRYMRVFRYGVSFWTFLSFSMPVSSWFRVSF